MHSLSQHKKIQILHYNYRIFDSVLDAYKPQVIVVQCGADSVNNF